MLHFVAKGEKHLSQVISLCFHACIKWDERRPQVAIYVGQEGQPAVKKITHASVHYSCSLLNASVCIVPKNIFMNTTCARQKDLMKLSA